MTNLNKLAREVHANAVAHGWWKDGDRPFGEIIATMHSELSEALEEYRNGNPNEYFRVQVPLIKGTAMPAKYEFETDITKWKGEKTEGIAPELADVILRILDYCGRNGIDIEGAIKRKHEYNRGRPYRHGGKKI